MRLSDFTGYVKVSEITDKELMKDIQGRLGVAQDGLFGPDTLAAFKAFKTKAHLAEPEMLGPSTAQALIRSKPTIITMGQARAIFGRSPSQAQLDDLNACLHRFDITTPARINFFLSQVAHESGGLKWMLELASGDAYEGRRDLGNIYKGDGRRFKGAGAIQLTGRYNYKLFSQYMQDPEVLRQGATYVAAKYPFTSAGFWWSQNKMNRLIDSGADIKAVSKRVNGGWNGLADRTHYYHKAVANTASSFA